MADKRSELRSKILSALAGGELGVGDRLPTENVLARQYGVSRATIREGMAMLVQEGVLARRRGVGTFVRSVASPATRLLAAMVPCVRGAVGVFDEIARGMEDEAHERGYSLILCNVDNDPAKAEGYLPRLSQDRVAGVLYVPMLMADERADVRNANLAVLECLEKARIAFVLVDSTVSADDIGRFSCVASNGYQAMRDVVRHLVRLGHGRIAYIRGRGVYSAEQRYLGFVDEMRRQGLDLPPEYVMQIRSEGIEEQGRPQVRAFCRLAKPPTAVACLHDLVAKNVVDELRRLGWRVPEDMAVVGFDDLAFAAHLEPPLTTVRQPLIEEGRLAVRLLVEKMEGRLSGERQEFLGCRLIVRRSCGANPS